MRPFDLPPDNPAGWLYADLRRPGEVREFKEYLSNPPADEHLSHEDTGPERPPRVEPLLGSYFAQGYFAPRYFATGYFRGG